MSNQLSPVQQGEGWAIYHASTYQLSAWESWLRDWQLQIDPVIRAAKAASEIAQACQQWADLQGVIAGVWTPIDQADIDFFLRQRNIVESCIEGVYAGKYMLRFNGDLMQIATRPDMLRDEYAADIWPETSDQIGLGIAPIIWVIVGGVALIGSLWGGAEIMKQANRLKTIDLSARTAALDATIAKTGNSTTINAWRTFKRQNADALKERGKEAQAADERGGLFSWIFGSGTGSKIAGSIGLVAIVGGLMWVLSRSGGVQGLTRGQRA